MCFLLRIFNYGIICSHNKIFLDSLRPDQNNLSNLFNVSESERVRGQRTCRPHCSTWTGPAPAWPRPRPGLWLVSRPASPARPAGPRSSREVSGPDTVTRVLQARGHRPARPSQAQPGPARPSQAQPGISDVIIWNYCIILSTF